VSDSELEEARKAVDEFLLSEDSTKLEDIIKDLGSRADDSWIYDYWVKAHLQVREPLTPHTNVPIIYENEKLLALDVIQRIAVIMHCTASVYKNFKENDQGCYWINNKRYSTDQFHGLLASMNNIKETMDTYYINDKSSEHIVFTYRNHFYTVQVLRDGEVVSANDVAKTLNQIVSETSEPMYPNANFVTVGVDRDEAGRILSEILISEENQESYQKIKDAIIVMNYDDAVSGNVYEELDNASYHKEHVNRWHGKGLQFSCTENGVFSFIADHSFVDGGTEIYFVNQLKQFIEEHDLSFDVYENNQMGDMIVKEIGFDLTDEIKSRLIDMKEGFDKCMNSFATRYVEFEGLSRSGLKENGILSGDGFIHLAFQVAQYMTYNHINNTYISVDARKFFRGRTECNRPVSNESCRFAEAFTKKEIGKAELLTMMNGALNEHHRRSKLCQAGKGVNRYLYVLESVFKEYGTSLGIMEKPSLFETEAYKIIGSNHLSTTSFGHPDMKYLYFPPVVPNGFGIFYMVADQSFMIITAYEKEVETMDQMIVNLQMCIEGMLDLIGS